MHKGISFQHDKTHIIKGIRKQALKTYTNRFPVVLYWISI